MKRPKKKKRHVHRWQKVLTFSYHFTYQYYLMRCKCGAEKPLEKSNVKIS